jgi:hypothetical protein
VIQEDVFLASLGAIMLTLNGAQAAIGIAAGRLTTILGRWPWLPDSARLGITTLR